MKYIHTLLLFCLYFPLPSWSSPHALLIAIQDYSAVEDLSPLQGSKNDIALVETMLQQHFNLKPENITTLVDQQATHTNIQNAFEHLAEVTKRNEFVYIHYAGHGSQVRDLEREEEDKRIAKDETWVPYGARSGLEGVDDYDILDDEIGAWLAAIYAKTDKVVFVSDSCHSATITRGEGLSGRAAPPDTRAHLLRGGEKLKKAAYKGIRVSATVDEHKQTGREALAVETLAADGKVYGLFSWHWVQALYHAGADATWQNVFMRAYAKVTADDSTFQQPQMEGEVLLSLDQFGFTAPLERGKEDSRPVVAVADVDGARVTLRAGHVNGVTEGSVYRLRDTCVTIREVGTFESVGERDGALEIGDLLVEESHNWRFDPVPVYVGGDFPDSEDRAILQAVRAALQDGKTMPGYTLTDNPREAQYHLHVVRPKAPHPLPEGEGTKAALPDSNPNQSPQLWVLTPQQQLLHDNLKISFDNIHAGLEHLAQNLNKILRIKELKALENPEQGEFPLEIQVVKLQPVAACPDGQDCITSPIGHFRRTATYPLAQAAKQNWRENDIISFTLHNRSRRDWYVYILNLGPDGKISAVYPAPGSQAEAAFLYSGKQRDLSGSDALQLALGEENIRFLVTAEAIDVGVLEQGRFRDAGSLNALERLLVNTRHGIRGNITYRNSFWKTAPVALEVKAP